MFNVLKKSLISTSVATALVLALAACGSEDAVSDTTALTGVDTQLTTIVTKSNVSGSLLRENGLLLKDVNGNYRFAYSGPVTTVDVDLATGVVKALSKQIGTVSGEAAFPQSFFDLALGGWDAANGGPMPAFPAVIPFSLNSCELTVGETVYKSTKILDDGSAATANMSNMLMEARAFTGLGPVEFGTLLNPGTDPAGMSMTVRTGGCGALVATGAGDNVGKMGTICLNGSFTFDISHLVLGENNMTSELPGTGNSNCTVVLHTPLQM